MSECQPIEKDPRIRNPKYLAWLRPQPCACCGANGPSEAAHIRSGSRKDGKRPAGGQEKPSDRWALPLHTKCHRRQHSMSEMAFWKAAGKDPFVLSDFYYMRYVAEFGDTNIQPRGPRLVERTDAVRPTKPVKPRKPREQRAKIAGRKTVWPKRAVR